jgi:transcriptional regulator with XRE-family HTH domain
MQKTIYTKEHKSLVGKLIKTRQKAALKQEDVAKLLGKTQSYVSKLESGQRRIDLVQLKELAEIYKVKLERFL